MNISRDIGYILILGETIRVAFLQYTCLVDSEADKSAKNGGQIYSTYSYFARGIDLDGSRGPLPAMLY